ncbi:MAG: carbohydrate porin [Planctomycetota bacterium]|jgi:carbohydrate-selective porin OprB
MGKRKFIIIVIFVLSFSIFVKAEEKTSNLWERNSITDGFWGLNNVLEDDGIELGLSLTQIYQQNLKGGLSTHRRQGRHTGSYDLELWADFEKLLGVKGGRLYIHTEGGWSRKDIDETSVGSFFGVNGDFKGRRSMDVTELWYEQALGESLTVIFGKMDLTQWFNTNAYTNDENTQFLNNALINNPALVPDFGLGVVVNYSFLEQWTLSGAIADSQADIRETGFNTAFHGEDFFFYIFELGKTAEIDFGQGPVKGGYRVGLWIDCQEKEQFSNSKNKRGDTGVYLSCDQMVYKENSEPADTQGLGLFGRYGHKDDKVNETGNFWSIGFQYEGLFEGRDRDVLGFGFAQGFFSDYDDANEGMGYSEDYCEVYYNTKITPWLEISPSLQYIINPGGDDSVSDALILGARAYMVF